MTVSPPIALESLIDRLFSLLIAADEEGSLQLIRRELDRGQSLESIVQETLVPLLRLINDFARADHITHRSALCSRMILAQLLQCARQHARVRQADQRFVTLTEDHGVLRARIAGPHVGERETPIISRTIRTTLDARRHVLRELVLDLSDVQVISSMALGMCLDLDRRARSFGLTARTCGADASMQAVLERLAPPTRRPLNRAWHLIPRAMRRATCAA